MPILCIIGNMTLYQSVPLDLLVGSETLVSGVNASTVTSSQNPATGMMTLTWPDQSSVAAGGKIGALAQAVNTTIPGYLSQLDAAALALKNMGHRVALMDAA